MRRSYAVAGCLWLVGASVVQAQLDPQPRQLIQVGYNQPLQGSAPIAGYAYYYLNEPAFLGTNYSLRLALAPIYLDAELGKPRALGLNTDLGLGIFGGGFAESYSEIDRGKYEKSESFVGHGGGLAFSLYHLFNPGSRVPLYGLVRTEFGYSAYSRDSDTDDAFSLPGDRWTGTFRTGLRYGGREPLLFPELAMELSGWYEAHFRTDPGRYGFGDREVEEISHLFYARALLIYTIPEKDHTLNISLTAGTSIDADRFNAYRLGGVLPLAAEFPLTLPGYLWQEISAETFGLLSLSYTLPLDRQSRWALVGQGTTALVDYVQGLSQPGNWHTGVGGGIVYRSPSDAWQILIGYGYGVDAIRGGSRGAHSIGFLLQFDLERADIPFLDVGLDPNRSRFLDRFFRH